MTIIVIIIILVILGLLFNLLENLKNYLSKHKWIIYLAVFLVSAIVYFPLFIIELIAFFCIRIFQKLKNNATAAFEKRVKILFLNLDTFNEKDFIDLCWNDKDLKKYYSIINITSTHNKTAFSKLLKSIIEDIAQKRISDFLLKTVQDYGAYTLDEVFEYAKQNNYISGFSNLKNLILSEITSLINDSKLQKIPLGENEFLYKNNTPYGKRIKSTVIEM